MKRVWAWLRSDTGRAATIALVPMGLLAYALSTQTRVGHPSTAGWIAFAIAATWFYLGWEYYL